MEKIAKKITFKGTVQGVGFRFTAQRIASRYELAGFVRNTRDGAVEMFAQGRPDDIADCLRDITETFAGYIRQTDAKDAAPNPRYIDFEITF